jgi:hypothetical protein
MEPNVLAPNVLPGDSTAQRECEIVMINLASQTLGVVLTKAKIPLPNGCYAEVDGRSEDGTVLCEAWAHHGAPKSGQKFKVIADAAKLFVAGRALGDSAQKFLVLADEAAASWFKGKSWMAQALREMDVQILIVDIPQPVRDSVLAAQKRQFR